MAKIKGVIFDLDGVICNTEQFHYNSWRKIAKELGFDFSHEFYATKKGTKRMSLFNHLLQNAKIDLTEEEKIFWTNKKNEYYLDFVNDLNQSALLDGVLTVLNDIKNRGLKLAIGSSSQNAKLIIEKLELTEFFPIIIDGTMVEKGKPYPDVYKLVCEQLQLATADCIVFEDAAEGVKAALAAGCFTVGIGDMKILKKADMVISGFEDMTFKDILDCVYR